MYLDCFYKGNELSGVAGEDLSNLERLGEEPLDLTGASDCQLIFFRQLIHTQDGNDILKRFVVLKFEVVMMSIILKNSSLV